ncbi:hypothetical protein SKAU_G00124470 [Synaphobranchus kaupii]|uniref:Uncharacterized protein n=1 Tax=Synaphobranchus kaupii TaxID=118154 RepID=A0A9Q1FPQ8_SYNKA|nr:hypothetical protein SKAU_G00124470 [Synaphobranchus kaupii]
MPGQTNVFLISGRGEGEGFGVTGRRCGRGARGGAARGAFLREERLSLRSARLVKAGAPPSRGEGEPPLCRISFFRCDHRGAHYHKSSSRTKSPTRKPSPVSTHDVSACGTDGEVWEKPTGPVRSVPSANPSTPPRPSPAPGADSGILGQRDGHTVERREEDRIAVTPLFSQGGSCPLLTAETDHFLMPSHGIQGT